VVAICVVFVPVDAVGAAGVPVNVGDDKSAFVAIAVEILTNSVLISVPLTIFNGSPEDSESFVAKFVLCV
jgi:hypothetical protein